MVDLLVCEQPRNRLPLGGTDGFHLHGHHGEHFQLDAIELIEAAPPGWMPLVSFEVNKRSSLVDHPEPEKPAWNHHLVDLFFFASKQQSTHAEAFEDLGHVSEAMLI